MRRLLALLTAGALLATAAACGSDDSGGGDGARSVKVGVIPIMDVAPLYLGEKQGFFRERGIDPEMVTAQGGAAIVPGVVSGQFEFGFSNVISLLIAQSEGVPLRVVANGVASTGEDGADFGAIVVRGDSGISSAKDLEGKKVAINTLKNIADTAVRASVRKDGGDPGKVEFTEIPFDQMPAALDKGQVDAAFTVEPALSTAKGQGAEPIASSYVDTAPDLTVALYFTSAELAEEDPELVEDFRAATRESLRYAEEHPDEVRDVLTTYTKIPPETLEAVTLPKWPDASNRASLETLAQLGRQDGLFGDAPDLDELLP